MPDNDLTSEARNLLQKLTEPQRNTLRDYGKRSRYGGSRQIANAFVKKGIAEFVGDPNAIVWEVQWTPLGHEVIRLLLANV